MEQEKDHHQALAAAAAEDSSAEVQSISYNSKLEDADAVTRIGLTRTVPRSLKGFLSLVGLNSSIVAPWPAYYFVAVLNLANGGVAGLFVGTIIAYIFMMPVYISLAEKIRKYPTAGGQYHWVAALAPPPSRRFLSFFCCCILTFTWLSYLASATWQLGLDVTAIILIYTGEYRVGYSFAVAVGFMVFAGIINLTWGKHMNYPEQFVLIIHVVAFFLLVGLLASASASGTLVSSFTFSSQTGWSPQFGVALSIVYEMAVLAGFDCASHVAEDTVDASKRIPKSLMWSVTVNGLSCVVVAVLFIFTAGNLNTLFAGPLATSGHPLGAIVQLTYNAAGGNKSLASAPFGLIAGILMMCVINTTTAASRMVFSFIRDDHNPYVHKFMATDLKREQVPRIAIIFTAISPVLILWINFVSDVGFQAIISQLTLSLIGTYLMAIGCSLYSRLYHPDILGRKWQGLFHLGTFWGSINDIIALVFLVFVWVLALFPYTTPVDAATLNYAPIIDGGIALLAIAYYLAYARKHYQTPAPKEAGNTSE